MYVAHDRDLLISWVEFSCCISEQRIQFRQGRKSTLVSLRKRASVMKGPVPIAFPRHMTMRGFRFSVHREYKVSQQEKVREMVEQIDDGMVVSVVKPVVQTKEKVVVWNILVQGSVAEAYICKGEEKVVGGGRWH